jgi:hypothetical protein
MNDTPEKILACAGAIKIMRGHKTIKPNMRVEYTRSDIADGYKEEMIRLRGILRVYGGKLVRNRLEHRGGLIGQSLLSAAYEGRLDE